MALKLVWTDGPEALQVIRTVQKIQGCAGVRDLQRLDGRELVPHLVEVHPVQNIRPISAEIDPDPSIPGNKQRFVYVQVESVRGISSGRVAARGPGRGKVGVKRRRPVCKRRHPDRKRNAAAQGQDWSKNHVRKYPGHDIMILACLERRVVDRIHCEDVREVEYGYRLKCVQPRRPEPCLAAAEVDYIVKRLAEAVVDPKLEAAA